MKLNVLNSKPWYKKGLKFHCTECGKCCSGKGGYVYITEQEAKVIAEHLKISEVDFYEKYVTKIENRLVLQDKKNSYDCIFLDGKKCSIYEIRPKQCQAFPWWESNLICKDTWENLKNSCEGIDHKDGKLYGEKEIDSLKV